MLSNPNYTAQEAEKALDVVFDRYIYLFIHGSGLVSQINPLLQVLPGQRPVRHASVIASSPFISDAFVQLILRLKSSYK